MTKIDLFCNSRYNFVHSSPNVNGIAWDNQLSGQVIPLYLSKMMDFTLKMMDYVLKIDG